MYKLVTDQRWVSRILRHLILFVSMVLLFTWIAHARSADGTSFWSTLLMVGVNAFFFFGYAYLTIYLLIPGLLSRRKVFLFILLFLLTGVGLSMGKLLFSDYIFFRAISPEQFTATNGFSLGYVLVNVKDMSFIVALFAIVKFARDKYVLESNIQELENKGLEAEIRLLEHQMDPHVIFNNFNNLYSISIYKPQYLASTVKSLKSMLNYLFRESKQRKVKLIKEIEMIDHYIGLEKLRYGERLDIQFKILGEAGNLEISPLILYPFVENCFVHGAGEDTRKPWIHIEISMEGSQLRFFAANSVGEGERRRQENQGPGANRNSIRRLEIQYPNSHRLAIKDRQHEHVVELHIRLI